MEVGMYDPTCTYAGVRTPCETGQIVYHKARGEKIPGIVIGFVIIADLVKPLVRWSDSMEVVEHVVDELSAEYDPFNPN
jgi:hypothetical protein